jgi:hypothetical protein
MSAAAPLPDSGRRAPVRTVAARTPRRSVLALVPSPMQARRAPFVALLLVLLAGGLVALLLLNTASAQDAFKLHALQNKEAALAQDIQVYSSMGDGLDNPATLAARASALGMVTGGIPVFLARGQALPAGAIRVGDEAYIPAPVVIPVIPATPKVSTSVAPKTVVKPKTAVVPKTAVKAPVAGAKTGKTGTAATTKAPVTTSPKAGTPTTPVAKVPTAKTPTVRSTTPAGATVGGK